MSFSVVDCATIADVLRLAGATPPSNPKKLMRCPLHNDSTPSFRVFQRGFRCFGCGKRGGVLDLVVALELATDRRHAARWLEQRLR